jgi:hypothetical protein
MLRWRHITLLLVCWGLVLWGSEAADEAGENSETTSGCYRSQLSEYETLFRNAFALKFEETGATESTVSVYINCMSFGQDKELETAIVSGNVSSAAGEQVLRFTCQEDMLFVLESEREFSKDRNESCLECAGPEPTAEDACLVPCAENCDRCYDTSETCDCTRRVYETDDELIREIEQLTEEEHIDVAIEEVIKKHSDCDSECPDHYETSEGDSSICYPCGIRFCAECHEEGGEGECTECLPHTELFHGSHGTECLFGELEEILHVAEEQEREVELEEEERNTSRITLAVTLPIVSLVVVAFFIFMSYIAHRRYPHIGETGKSRHRNKPLPSLTEEEHAVDDSVFRPRPTVRLR